MAGAARSRRTTNSINAHFRIASLPCRTSHSGSATYDWKSKETSEEPWRSSVSFLTGFSGERYSFAVKPHRVRSGLGAVAERAGVVLTAPQRMAVVKTSLI